MKIFLGDVSWYYQHRNLERMGLRQLIRDCVSGHIAG